MDLAALREHYSEVGLRRDDLAPSPIEQFERWFEEWLAAKPYDVNAVILATTGSDGWPSARAVLLKGVDERGFVFHTNRRSPKGRDLDTTKRGALCFLWHPLERQVRVTGNVRHLPEDESDSYFDSRPRGAQIAAWASPQSEVINDRSELDRLTAVVESRFTAVADVPRPPHWGGYLLRPHSVEFWQGRRNRMHDRLRYRRCEPSNSTGALATTQDQAEWMVERLAP